jgi:outer membrane protein insertion porin family
MISKYIRKFPLILILFVAILPTVFLSSGASAANQPLTIREVKVEGNRRVETGTILLQTSSQPGLSVDEALLDADIKQIFRTGFFSNVESRVERIPGGVRVVFVVDERPAIRSVYLKGNENVTDDTLKEKLNIGARRFLDRGKITAGIEQAKAHYQGLGYYDVEISVEETAVEGGEVDLTFVVNEGEKKRIRQVVFEGNSALSDDELHEAIKTGEYFWLTSWVTGTGVLKREVLENDSRELTRLYLNNGFVDARVGAPEILPIENGLKVVFKVSEGEKFTFGKVSATGTLLNDSEEETLKGIESKSGETFSAEKLRKDTFTITEKFSDRGFAFTNVTPNTAIDRANKSVSVVFQVDKGAPVSINRINVTGNRKTADNVIRRSMQIHEQELFSSSKIRRSQEILQRLGHFEEVNISTEPSAEQHKIDLNVAVREGNTGTFSIGAGISSGDGFIISGQVSENNLFGSGNSLTLDINSGTRRENFILSFNNPRVNDTYWSFGVDALSVLRDFEFFQRKQMGGSFTLGYPLWFLGEELLEDIRASITYELTQVDIAAVREDRAPQFVKDQQGKTTASSVTPRVIRNTINNPLDPTAGSRQSLAVEVAGAGGDQEFYLAQVQNTMYIHLFDTGLGPLIFSPRQRFGYGETFGDDPFPLYRRFFPGGINSNRGYDARRMGPKDPVTGEVFGGSSEILLNFDLIFPLIESVGLRGLVFFDAGNAFDDGNEFGKLRKAVGWGFRWRSPIAPIRIEFGYPLDKERGDSGFVTNFSFGNPL